MNTEGVTKAPKDKNCPYCGQAFTSSSLGRHLDLYIKSKNPKAPDGIHNVEEIRRVRGSITRRQPRGGARRDTLGGSQSGSKRSPAASDTDSVSVQSPGTSKEVQSTEDHNTRLASYQSHVGTARLIDETLKAGDGNAEPETTPRLSKQRVFSRQAMKSSVDIRQRVQDALDTAKAAELALREMISSWRAAKQQIDLNAMPFDFDPLSLDFPALCLQCLEPTPTLFSSTQHPTSTSWSIMPPGERQNEALVLYFEEEFRKWKVACSAATTTIMDEVTYPAPQSAGQHEKRAQMVQKAEEAASTLQQQVTEHLASAFYVWRQLPIARQQELWILEMARNIGRKQKQVQALKEAQQSLKQENSNLKFQIDNLNRQQQPREFRVVPPMTLKVDEKLLEIWTEAGIDGHRATGTELEERHPDLNTVVSGAIERWKSVIVSSRAAASGLNAQRTLDQPSAPLKTPTSVTQPPSPVASRTSNQRFQTGGNAQYHQSSPNAPNYTSAIGLRQMSLSPSGHTITMKNNPGSSMASTPADSSSDVDEEEDAEGDADEDVDAIAAVDVEMQNEPQYLSAANTPTVSHHAIQQLPHHEPRQAHQMHITRSQSQQMSAPRHNPYPPRSGSYASPGVLPSQQMHMAQQTFGHQLQSLEHHLGQAHGGVNMGWGNH